MDIIQKTREILATLGTPILAKGLTEGEAIQDWRVDGPFTSEQVAQIATKLVELGWVQGDAGGYGTLWEHPGYYMSGFQLLPYMIVPQVDNSRSDYARLWWA